jgi:hypothetical protein
VDASLAVLSAHWLTDRFECWVSSRRELDDAHAAPPERFTALVVGQLLCDLPSAQVLTAQIALASARAVAGADRVHFFHETSRLPPDADCTAVAYLLLLRTGQVSEDEAHRAFDLIARTTNPDGIVATYFDPCGERANIVDAVVCANVVRLALRLGRAQEVWRTARYLRQLVLGAEYLDGSRYYPSPDCLLYALSLGEPFDELRAAVETRIGATDHVIDLAQRVLAARRLGVTNSQDRDRLLARRRPDGSWPAEGWFCYGRSKHWFGSSALSTAFALAALGDR